MTTAALQKVLVVPRQAVAQVCNKEGFFSDPSSIYIVKGAIEKQGIFVDRQTAESTESYQQIVACSIVRKGEKVLCIRRTKTSNRAALRLRWTVVLGGHVDDTEADLINPVESCLLRELDEELGIKPLTIPTLLGVVVDPGTPVGRLHLGILYDVAVPMETITLSPKRDVGEFAGVKKEMNIKMMSPEEISKGSLKLDPWSRLFLSSAKANEIFGSFPFSVKQQSFPFVWR